MASRSSQPFLLMCYTEVTFMAYDETHDRLTVETCQGYNAFPDLADGTAEHQKTFNLSTNSQTRHVFRLSALDGTINHLLPCHATPCHDMSCMAERQKTFNLSTIKVKPDVFFCLSALDGTRNHFLPCHATCFHDMSCHTMP